jgi:cytochrome c biogenesis protein CcdA
MGFFGIGSNTLAEQCTSQITNSNTCSIGTITALALADAVNPCAMAVLTMVLISILTNNPKNKRKVLFAGFAFSLAVFIGYLLYGTIIIEFFNTFAEFSRANSIYIYKGLAILAIILGALQIKDYFFYQAGGIATEMPLWMRPYAKLTINQITSPIGAFFIGILVTLFLLPCTIGPYIVASGLLAQKGIVGALPWLIYYNILFILPMIIITLIVYCGFSKVEEVSGWKERNIKRLHLVAGILIFIIGLLLLFGWI